MKKDINYLLRREEPIHSLHA